MSDKKGMTFASGLRTVLRQDPDVIMVGEIRDEDTARMAIQSSLTGHLVFSTLHTNDAPGAVTRLIDLGIEPYLVSGSLRAVMAQRLMRQVCTSCRRQTTLAVADAGLLQLPEEFTGRSVFTAVGCDVCHGTGYRDRKGVFELLTVTEAIQEQITSGARSGTIRGLAREDGMTTLRDDAVRKLLGGITTVDEVLRVTQDNTE